MVEQRRSAVSEQQLYSRLVFYGRFMNAALPLHTGDPRGYLRGRRLDVTGREGEPKKREERMRRGFSLVKEFR